MGTSNHVFGKFKSKLGDSKLAQKLADNIEGEVLFDRFSRGLYSTDASIYQIEPIGIVVPKTTKVHKLLGFTSNASRKLVSGRMAKI